MSIVFHWFLPTNGDGRRLVEPDQPVPGVAGGQRPATLDYLTQIASAAEKFFPDTGATSVSCTSTINSASDVIGIFSAIGTSLSATSPRLILNSTS